VEHLHRRGGIMNTNYDVLSGVVSSIPDEKADAEKYHKLADEATDLEERGILNSIAVDELKHENLLENIVRREGINMPDSMGDLGDKTIEEILNENTDNTLYQQESPVELTAPKLEAPFVPVPEESTAAEHFGRAICLGKAHRMKADSELTPEEKKCIYDTGMKWEEHILEKVGNELPAINVNEETVLVGSGGKNVGQLRLVNGRVTMCLNTKGQAGNVTPRCVDVGHGFDSFVTAQQILELLGIETQSITK
jgi:hypothetical protein